MAAVTLKQGIELRLTGGAVIHVLSRPDGAFSIP